MNTREHKRSKAADKYKEEQTLEVTLAEPELLSPFKKSRLLYFRADTAKTVSDIDDGHQTPVKTSVLINQQDSMQMDELESAAGQNFSAIPGYRPAQRVTKFSLKGSPLQIVTPNQTVLDRTNKNGVFYIFSNHAKGPRPQVSEIKEQSHFFDSSQYQAIKTPKDNTKTQQLVITPEILKHKDKRSSQNAELVDEGHSAQEGSATQYAKATELFSNKEFWEWLHLVAFRFIGKDGQHEANLVAGTAYANTDMMFVENLISYFSRAYPEGFLLDVRADLIEGTQIAKEISYLIETKDFVLSFVFNAQNDIKPHILYQEYLNSFGKALLDVAAGATKSLLKSNPRKIGLGLFHQPPSVPSVSAVPITSKSDELDNLFKEIKSRSVAVHG
jgi:hypothetical protein